MNHVKAVRADDVRYTSLSCIKRALICVLFAGMISGAAALSNTGHAALSPVATEAGHQITDEMLKRILQDSGVLSQISNLPATIIAESEQDWQGCSTSDAQLALWINTIFSAEEMTRRAIDELHGALNAEDIASVIHWLNSASGKVIVEAERASGALNEGEFESYISQLNTSPDFQTERAPRIRTLVKRTRVAELVSVLNTELNAAVFLATACSPDHDTVKQLLKTANLERQNLGLETVMMAINLQAPTAVVYRTVDDAVIDDYLEFAASDAGQAYHAALINVIRDTMIDRLEALGSKLSG